MDKSLFLGNYVPFFPERTSLTWSILTLFVSYCCSTLSLFGEVNATPFRLPLKPPMTPLHPMKAPAEDEWRHWRRKHLSLLYEDGCLATPDASGHFPPRHNDVATFPRRYRIAAESSQAWVTETVSERSFSFGSHLSIVDKMVWNCCIYWRAGKLFRSVSKARCILFIRSSLVKCR